MFEIAFRFQVSTLNGSGNHACICATLGSGPPRASTRPMQLVQLAEMNFHHMNSPPALTSWRPPSSYDQVKSSRRL
jgi:hypothetical protein